MLTAGSGALGANIIHEFYVPLPEAQVRTALVSIEPASGIVGTTIESVISIVATGGGTVIHYDQWEDGYEVDLNNPTQSTTQIWGDGNDANGKPPGYANDPASMPAGAVIVLRNQIPLPRNAANYFFDGRDRFGGTKALVVSRASWATTPGTVLCGANEVLATMDYGTSFVAPVGDDVSASSMFEFVGLFVMARDDSTQVTIDPDGTGPTAATVVTLNRGESYLVNGAIKKGATVNSTKPVQVDLITGDIGARYESRRFTLYPLDQWSSTMYSPLGTASNGDTAFAFLYNPGASAITVNVVNNTGSGSFSVPSKGVYQYTMAKDSGAKFTSSNGAPFFGIVTVGASTGANNVHDWGFSMLPSDNLTTEAVVGWGPGSSDGTQNGSPVWVTPTAATRVYVDYGGDGVGSLTDPKGKKYDVHYDLAALSTKTVYDPDKDQTAMHLYTLDGVAIAAAWGQDPATAGAATPYLDCGTTVLPFPVPILKKSSIIAVDNGATGMSLNDILEYTITVDNHGLLPLGNLLVLDPLHPSLSYMPNSTKRDGVDIPDSPSGTLFPLDGAGYTVPIILRSGTTTFKYRAQITGTGTITNTATNPAYSLVVTNDVVVPTGGGSTPCTIAFTDNAGADMTAYGAGSSVYATLTDPDSNLSSTTIEQVSATITDATTGDVETITLVETGVNTGIFRNTTGLPTSTSTGAPTQDGTLYVATGHTITVTHLDTQFGETCSDTAVISVPTQNKFLYLNDALALDRVDPIATSDGTTANTTTLGNPFVVAAATTTGTILSGTTLTFSHTPGTGSNRLLVVGISTGFTTNNGNAPAVNTVTFGGVGMTQLGSMIPTTPQGTRSYIYYLLNPPSAAANVVVTTASSASVVAGATTYNNVNQTTPLGAFASTTSASANPGVTSLSTSIASAVGDLVYAIGSWDEGGTDQAITAGAGQTDVWKFNGFDFTTAGASTKTATSTSTSMSYTAVDSQESVLGGMAIKPVTGGTLTTTFTQAPTFASSFTMPTGAAPIVRAYYTVTSGTMPASPSITAVLKRGATTIATSSSVSAAAGLMTFTFPAFGANTSFAAGEAMALTITTAQSDLTFTVDYDSSTAPSKITLPTTTVIGVSSLGVYDAPYPGGSLVSSPASGTTVYVRSTATDPFGNTDITSMGLNIDGPGTSGDITTTLNSGQVVATTTGSKTYEYPWAVSLTTGAYNISVTANEGTEGIQATSATTVTVTQQDLGTPSTTEFTTGPNGPGTLIYAGNETVYVRVTDLDQNTNPLAAETVKVTITSQAGADTETNITLTETGPNTGIFVGSIPASTTGGTALNNGTLHAVLGDVLYVVYVDPDDSTDTSNDTATIPNATPTISVNKTLVSPSDGQARVGESVEYSVQVTNTGNSTLSSVQLTDTFPAAKLAYVSASTAPNTVGSGSLTWTNIGPLTQGQSKTFTLTFTALASAAPAINSATADAGGGVTSTDTANVNITNPLLTVSKTIVSPLSGSVDVGNNVTYQIHVQNTGDTNITTLPVEDLYSGSNFEFVSATPVPDASGSGSLLWQDVTGAGSLAPGQGYNINVTLRAKGGGSGANNSAEVNYAVDEHNDPVPPVTSTATITVVSATISGTVYNDADKDGVFDVGETGIADVTVNLYTDPNSDGNPADGVLVAIATTGSTGAYDFPNLAAGTYVVVESDPPGYASSGDTWTGNDNRIRVIVSTLTAYPGNNFFDYLPNPSDYATIGGTVWNDVNVSGTVNGGESGIPNVPVDLIQDVNGNGTADPGEPVYSSTLTAADGTYSFSFVPPGNYVIREYDLFGYASTGDAASPNNNQIPAVLTAGAALVSQDFFDVQAGTVSGHAYFDTNGDGDQDPGEPNLQNLRLVVTDVTGTPQTVVTNSSGNWSATVPPGSTSVDVDESSFANTGVLSVDPVYGVGPVRTQGTDPTVVNVTAGSTTDGGTDGYTNGTWAAGFVFHDHNGNGVQDPGDNGVPNVNVVVTASSGGPQTVVTDSNGRWTALVPPGSVTANVDESDPDFTAVFPTNGWLQTYGTDPNTITATQGQVNVSGGDGYYVAAILTGRLYLDRNGNGSQDPGELGIGGVTINITQSDNSTKTAVTDSNGNWSALVLAGTTTANVDESDPDFTAVVLTNAYQQYVHTQGDDPTTVTAVSGVTSPLQLDGYFNPAVVYGHAYFDSNGDGDQDPGEPNLQNLSLVITDVSGIPQTVTTNSNGDWSATVSPGSTSVNVDESSFASTGLLTVDPVYGVGPVHTEGTDPTVVTVPLGGTANGGTDGYTNGTWAAGFVFHDHNGNGVQDPGDDGLSNVNVVVTDSSGIPQTVVTGTGGRWTAQVLPGSVTANVDELDPDFTAVFPTNGWLQTFGTDPNTITATQGQVNVSGGDGYYVAAILTGRLYLDNNGNGTQDPGELGIGGVTINITQSDNSTKTAVTDSNGNWTALVLAGTTTANVDESDPQFIAAVLSTPYQQYVHTQGDDPTTVNAVSGVTSPLQLDGYFNPTVVYGHVFFDMNGDGIQNGLEPDLINVSVKVTDANNNEIIVSTNSSGNWIAQVVGGDTQIEVDESDPDFTAVVNSPNYIQTVGSNPSTITTPQNVATFAGNDGYFIPATVTGRLYLDLNHSGIYDPGEPGIPDVDVIITDSAMHQQVVTTDSNGIWTVLVLGGDTIADIDTSDPDYLAHVPPGSPRTEGNDPTTVTAVVNAVTPGGNDGWALLGAYSISGQVRDDIDEDGMLTDNDTPVANVTIKLWLDFNGNGVLDPGDPELATTTTDLLGSYTFTGLPDGRYLVQEINPAGATSTADADGANDDLIAVTIAGASVVAEDFLDAVDPSGYAYDTVTGQIIAGGSISVSGPGSVTVLMDGSNGQYSFLTDGTPGSYIITYTPPAGYIIDPARPVAGASFDPTGGPDPTSLGSSEDPLNAGYMAARSAVANPYYLTFVLESGDPLVINNNIPLRLQVPKKYVYWKEVTPGGGPNPGSNGDNDCYSDIIEYALNLNPNTGVQTAPVFRGSYNSGTGKVDVAYNRIAGGLDDITYTLVGITNLTGSPGGWTPLTLIPTITPNGDGTETVTYADVESDPYFTGRTEGIVRLKVDYDANADTVADATASTPAYGWNRRTLNAECVMTGYPYLKPKLFCGTVDGIVGNALDVTTSAGGTSLAASLVLGRQYFVEVYSGDNAGQRFDLNEGASTATSIALDLSSPYNTLPVIPASIAGDKVVVREHTTLDDVLNKNQFTATLVPTTADRVLFYNRTSGNFRTYWLLNHPSGPRWILTGDATMTDRGGLIMAPGEGWYTHPRGGAQVVVWNGMVRANPFALPLYAGSNFVGSGYPMDQSPAMRGMTIAAGFTGSRDPGLADQLLFWKGYNTDQSMAYHDHFLLSAGAIQRWTEQSNAKVIDENNLPLFKPTTGAIYRMRNNLPGFVMPMPWTP